MNASDLRRDDDRSEAFSGTPIGADDADAVRERLHLLSHYLDTAFEVPGTNVRVGLDPLVGLLPVVGDLPTSALSAYIVAEAAAMGAPRATIARMVANVAVDAVFGSLPVVGDVFDAAWKANARNVRLLESRLDDPTGSERDGRVVALLGVGLFVATTLVGAGVAAGVWVLLSAAGLL